MKASLIVVGLVLPIGIALAQNTQQPADSQPGTTAQSQSKASTSTKAEEKTESIPELKTQTYKGMLVDASCAAGGSSSTSSASSTSGTQSAADRSATGKTGEASRAGDANQSCVASANTSAFGLRVKDGRVLRFDAVGNERAKEAFTARKKWTESSAAGKNIQATVSGAESGDRLTVVSIH